MAQWGRIATCCERIELLGVGAVGTLDGAVELGGARGQHEPVQTALPAGRLELGRELRSALDLQGARGKDRRGCKVSRNGTAVAAGARGWA